MPGPSVSVQRDEAYAILEALAVAPRKPCLSNSGSVVPAGGAEGVVSIASTTLVPGERRAGTSASPSRVLVDHRTHTAHTRSKQPEPSETLQGTPVRFVSFSVDPGYDTPEVLRAYAEQRGADTTRWTFLTGDNEAVEEVVVRGLRVRMGSERDATGNILHGSHFVLVDGTGHIRGYYESNPEGLDDLARDAKLLSE